MIRISASFLFLSCLVTLWLSHELGQISFTKSFASGEKKNTPGDSKPQLEEKSILLRDKEAELSRRELALNGKEKILNEQMKRCEQTLTEQMKRCEKTLTEGEQTKVQLKKEFDSKDKELEELRNSQLESFREVYEQMEPKKAARILDELDLNLASKVLASIKPNKAAEILSRMNSGRARLVTERYLKLRMPTSTQKKVNGTPENQSKGGEK